jgi:hypothetical protein
LREIDNHWGTAHARRRCPFRAPARLYIGEDIVIGYRIPEESVPISLENVQTDYNGAESRVTFYLSNGNQLILIFPHDGGCVLGPRVDGGIVISAANFKREFPISLVIVPVHAAKHSALLHLQSVIDSPTPSPYYKRPCATRSAFSRAAITGRRHNGGRIILLHNRCVSGGWQKAQHPASQPNGAMRCPRQRKSPLSASWGSVRSAN